MSKEKVFWKKAFIGYLIDGEVDNFDYFGEWLPEKNSKLVDEFYKKIEVDGEVYVCVGNEKSGMIGNVVDIPMKSIGLRRRGWYENGLENIDDKDLP